MESGIPFISTKLQPPGIRDDILHRQRLVDRLADIPRQRITLLCAGAGYGKTTLLSAATSLDVPIVWYTLSPSDNDLAVFSFYLVQGIRRYRVEFGQRVLDLLTNWSTVEQSGENMSKTIATELINAFVEIDNFGGFGGITDGDNRLIIVLDDFHTVDHSQSILDLVDYLLIRMPALLHLVIATRRPPHLPSLPRLRMSGQVNDIDELDLRFTQIEIQTLLNDIHGLDLSDEKMNVVVKQTEGWIIGLQLAAQSLKARSEPSPSWGIAPLRTNRAALFEYLAEEVFKQQSQDVQHFLCESALLSTFTPEICDAIFGRNDSMAMIETVVINNLFAVEVNEGCWRYHQLFRDYLRQQLKREPERLRGIHRAAGDYFTQHGDYHEAVQHYLASADYQRAATAIKKAGPSILRVSGFDTLTYWIGQIPENHLNEMPDLLLLQARVFELRGYYDQALEWLSRVEKVFTDQGNTSGLSRVMCNKAHLAARRLTRNTDVRNLYREGLLQLDQADSQGKADLLRFIGLACIMEENAREARQHYDEALRIYEEIGDLEGVVAALIALGSQVHMFHGDFSEALAPLRRALAIAGELGSKHEMAECLGFTADCLRWVGHFEDAKVCANQALQLSREIGAVHLEVHSLICLGTVCLGGQERDLLTAVSCCEEAARLAEAQGNERLRLRALTRRMVALRRLRRLPEAIALANQVLSIADNIVDRWLAMVAKLYVAEVFVESHHERAETLLLQAREVFQRFEDKANLAVVNFWLAVLYHRSNPGAEIAPLTASLDIAVANRYNYVYVEEANVAAPLLSLAVRRALQSDYCLSLLNSMGCEYSALVESLQSNQVIEEYPQSRPLLSRYADLRSAEAQSRVMPAKATLAQLACEYPLSKASPVSEREIPSLRFTCFGNFEVTIGEKNIEERAWQRRKAKSLLKYLAIAPECVVTGDGAIEALWPDLDSETAKVRLKSTLHVLRRVLEPHSTGIPSRYVTYERGILKLRSEHIRTIDVVEFERQIAAGQRAERAGDLAAARREFEAAEVLYAGDLYADDLYEEWTIPKRQRLRDTYLRVVGKLAKWRVEARDYDGAIGYLENILERDRANEDAHLLFMRCLALLGKRNEALRQYSICCRSLREELSLEPSKKTREYYTLLLAGQVG